MEKDGSNGQPKKPTLAGWNNGNAITYRWLLGVLVSVVIGVGGFYLHSISSSLDDINTTLMGLSNKQSGQDQHLTNIDGRLNDTDSAIKTLFQNQNNNQSRLSTVEEWQREHDQKQINQLEKDNKAGRIARNRDWKSVSKQFKAEEDTVYP